MRALKSIVTLVLLAGAAPVASLLGCEGEPPVMAPENTMGAGSAVASASASATPEPASEPTAAQTACPPPPCAPAASSVASAAPAGSASPEGSSAALPVPPTSIPRGNIVGAVTTKPAALQGQAVVYLEDGPKEDVPARLQTVKISERTDELHPVRLGAGRGRQGRLLNEDPFPHNVFSPDNEKFNMGNIPQHGAHVRVFHAPARTRCSATCTPGCSGT